MFGSIDNFNYQLFVHGFFNVWFRMAYAISLRVFTQVTTRIGYAISLWVVIQVLYLDFLATLDS